MASSRKPIRSRPAGNIVARVESSIAAHAAAGDRLLLGLSGGVDSVVLLHALTQVAPRQGVRLEAMHVNHGLSPHAHAWVDFCRALCERAGVAFHAVCVEVARGNSVERAAREARYHAMHSIPADHLVLAHNRNDQAETVLLQLLRGTGVQGLAAMSHSRDHKVRTGAAIEKDTQQGARSIIRPLLDVPRLQIERYASEHALQWIEDASNAELKYTRNWIRHAVLPLLESRVPSAGHALARVAGHMSEAAQLLEDLGAIDAARAASGEGLDVNIVRALGAHRARNLLRHLIRQRGGRMPDAKRLGEALRQSLEARADANPLVTLGDYALRRRGGVLYLLTPAQASRAASPIHWSGDREIVLASGDGVLTMVPGVGHGLSAARLQAGSVTIRAREGGERLQPDPKRPRRTVKNLLQEARVPTWKRDRLPFIYCGTELACVPGVAVDWRFGAAGDEPSIVATWCDSGTA